MEMVATYIKLDHLPKMFGIKNVLQRRKELEENN